MQAFEFEINAKRNLIEIPPQYKKIYSKHMKVILLVSEKLITKKQQYDFSDVVGKLEWQGDAVQEQRNIRDEW
ncbi:hypothetical protein PN36_21005 [Candidatus Thiomargarita nelsonii]|uniref:Uncharacterized protein n=1 Tax=Candidatus Thiomargarita nelsonii TaxID=1003181 RepID=A0A0A6S4E6_9GAMM|nr:hypothetical protein PN36_21005 [Candidatus Thiomargarita nelsonii]